MRRVFLLCVLLVATGATGPRAQSDSAGEHNPYPLRDTIVVTANRFGEAAEKVVWPTVAVGQAALQTEIGVPDLLDGVGGVDVRQAGGVGSIGTLSSWGLFNRHLLLLYNGRVVKDYSLGGFNLAEYELDEFERVEIVKGPQSAYYGADAVGGVVNLVSKKTLVDRFDATARVGSQGMRSYGVDVSRRLAQFGLGGFVDYAAADNSRDNSGVERIVAGFRSEYLSPDDRHYVSVSGRYFHDSLGVPGPQPDPVYIPVYGNAESSSLFDHQTDRNYSLDGRYRFNDRRGGEIQIDLFWEKKTLDYYGLYNYQSWYYVPDGLGDSSLFVDSVDVAYHTIADKRSAGVSGRARKESSTFDLAMGVDWLAGKVGSSNREAASAVNIIGPYAPYSYSYGSDEGWSRTQNQFDVWTAAVAEPSESVRLDQSGRLQFVHNRKVQPSYNLGGQLVLSERLRFKLGYGYAFRLPTIAEQYTDDLYVVGNPDLKAETAHSLVGTLSWQWPSADADCHLSVFRQVVDGLIQYDWSVFPSRPRNVDRFRSSGLDFGVRSGLSGRVGVAAGLVYQKAKQTFGSDSDLERANYVPDLKGRVGLTYRASRTVSGGLSAVYTGERAIRRSAAETKVIDQVLELNLTLTASVTGNITLTLTGSDLTDQKRPDQFGFTQTDLDYPTPGRRVMLKATWSLQ